jgi:hypothetical protein
MFLTITVRLEDDNFNYKAPRAETTLNMELPNNSNTIYLGNLAETLYAGAYETLLKKREEEEEESDS